MSLSTDPQMPRLPKRLPVGSVYVVEGRVGRHGHLRVSSRYLVMPSGEKLAIPVEPVRTLPVRSETERLVGRHVQSGSPAKRFTRATKKFAPAAGTRRQKQR
jgi:hypothetical protein